MRIDGRKWDEIRPVTITPGYVDYAEGSALIVVGKTRVLCNATVEASVPAWRQGQGAGWITAEYAMLPRATQRRMRRETLNLTNL
jgi:ribonuclease PH